MILLQIIKMQNFKKNTYDNNKHILMTWMKELECKRMNMNVYKQFIDGGN